MNMIDRHCYCVIMAGGTGSKLWPVSRAALPKQFIEQEGTGLTFYRHTFNRCCSVVLPENVIVVTTERYRELVLEQTPELRPENLLVEPYIRNTAPCVAYAAYTLLKRDPEAVFAVLPSDNIIKNSSAFRADILSAMAFVSANEALVTMGVVPTRPDPNYGYIQAAGGRDAYRRGEPLRVKTFTEKPDVEIARVFMASGEFLWNSGIFVWRASVLRDELAEHMPELTAWFGGWEDALGTPNEGEFLQRAYSGIQKSSIDLGIMESTSKAWVYPADFDWADIGSWDSLYNVIPEKDTDGNRSNSHHTDLQNCSNNLVITTDGKKLVAVKGLDNFLVVDTEDVLMICPRNEEDVNDLFSDVAMPGLESFR